MNPAICNVCQFAYNHSNRKPIIMNNCSHSICDTCLKAIIKFGRSNKCPTCREEFNAVYINYYALPFIQRTTFDQLFDDHNIIENNIYIELKELSKIVETERNNISYNDEGSIDEQFNFLNKDMQSFLDTIIFYKHKFEPI
jgi:hypothetical protein